METFEAITTRYACRVYDTETQLTEEQVSKLIQAANAAPAASRDYSVIKLTVAQEKTLREAIDAATAHAIAQLPDHPTFQAPALFILSVKINEKIPFVGYCNASVAAENIMVQANAMGLASVFLMGVPMIMQSKPELLEKLHITDGFKPVVVVAVGYAKTPQQVTKPIRLAVERF